MLDFAKSAKIDLTIVGPEQPLADGIVDLFEQNDLPIFGPTRRAAELEWSKVFAKEFMVRHGIPTSQYKTFGETDMVEAKRFVRESAFPLVLKADGLAAGKGVSVCETLEAAYRWLEDFGKHFGSSSSQIIVEEFIT